MKTPTTILFILSFSFLFFPIIRGNQNPVNLISVSHPVNQESYQKFRERIAKGEIPRNAKIGGGIAIHATRPQEEWTVDYYQNWTDGCVSLKYTEAADLYSYIPVGTPVTIEK